MPETDPDVKKIVKSGTKFLSAFIILIIGFLGGVFFRTYTMERSPRASMKTGFDLAQWEKSIPLEGSLMIDDLEKAASESPEDAGAWIALGNAYFDHDMPEKAIPAYKTALKYQPGNADVWTDLGIMYRRIGQPDQAIAAFDSALAADPQHEASLLNKGTVELQDLNNPSGAVEAWRKLLQLNPEATSQNGMRIKDLVEKIEDEYL